MINIKSVYWKIILIWKKNENTDVVPLNLVIKVGDEIDHIFF